jgi:hypothetical protein
MISELRGIWKEGVVDAFGMLSQHFPGLAEGKTNYLIENSRSPADI